MSLHLKGIGTIKEFKKQQQKEDKAKQEEDVWVLVIRQICLSGRGWVPGVANWFSPGRENSGGWHFHLNTSGTLSGCCIVSGLWYTSTNNNAHHGNFPIDLDFYWDGDAQLTGGRLRVRLQNANDINRIHVNQRPYLERFLEDAMIIQRELLE
jgi:hypothetical protein